MHNELFWMYGFFIVIFGLCIGSFLNVAALRALWEESIVLPPSKCPSCKTKLKWYDNIPVLSWVLLLGKCRYCKCKISAQYPTVELANAVLYFVAYWQFGLSLKTLFVCVLLSLFILITVTDYRERVVFDRHTYPIIALGLLYSLLGLGVNIWQSLLGVALGFVFFEVVARLGYLFAPTRAFGEGDTVIAMGLGAFFGWEKLVVIVLLSIFFQALLSMPLLLIKAYRAKNYKMCTALGLLGACLLVVFIFKHFNLYEYFYPTVAMLLGVTITLFWCMKAILGGMKEKKEEELLYLPFGPALVICATAVLFFPALSSLFNLPLNLN